MGRQAFERKMAELETLRHSASPAGELRKSLRDRNNYLVSKAAAITGELGLRELVPDLVAAFERFLSDPVKSDPQCWAKNAIAKSLKDLDYDEPEFFLRGMKHFQMEPVWGRREDTAQTLRAACLLALVGCPLPRLAILPHLVDALGDPAKTVRADAARAMAQIGGVESLLLLRLKAICGDSEAEVVGTCLAGMLAMAPRDSIRFIAGFLDSDRENVPAEAAAVLSESSDPEALAILREKGRSHANPDVRRVILLSLGASRMEGAAEFLLSIVAEGRPEDAAHAIRALAAGRFREEYRDRVLRAAEARPELMAAYRREFR